MCHLSQVINRSAMEDLLSLFLLTTVGNAEAISNGEQLGRGESDISLNSNNTIPHICNAEMVFTEEQIERSERRNSVSNGMMHSYNVQTIFTEEELVRRNAHLNAFLSNGIRSLICPVILITCNYNPTMSIPVSEERCGQMLSDNAICQTNSGTVFDAEQLGRSERLTNCFSDNTVTHVYNVAQTVIEEQPPRRERCDTAIYNDSTTYANNVESIITKVEQDMRESCVTVFSDKSVTQADHIQTVFAEEQTEKY